MSWLLESRTTVGCTVYFLLGPTIAPCHGPACTFSGEEFLLSCFVGCIHEGVNPIKVPYLQQRCGPHSLCFEASVVSRNEVDIMNRVSLRIRIHAREAICLFFGPFYTRDLRFNYWGEATSLVAIDDLQRSNQGGLTG